ncbi:MAG TPA: YjbF family lipoprotein [Rhizomicrobium sp.]
MARLCNTWTILSNLKARRTASVVGAVLLLGGCADTAIFGGDAAAIYAAVKNSWGASGKKVTLEEAAAVPYASMGVRLGNSPQAMIILAGDSDGQRLWTSGAGVAIMTRAGRIVRTAGFPYNLGGYGPGTNSVDKDGVRSLHWQADFPDLKLYSVPIVCRERPARNETIVILGKDIHTQRVDESCTSEGGSLDWSFGNTFWIDPSSGLVWRSIQHIHPQLDSIETEILRPPG